MPKVDPESGQMLSDDPDQEDEELAGGHTETDIPKDHADTGHHSPISAAPGGQDDGPQAQGDNLQNNPGGGST